MVVVGVVCTLIAFISISSVFRCRKYLCFMPMFLCLGCQTLALVAFSLPLLSVTCLCFYLFSKITQFLCSLQNKCSISMLYSLVGYVCLVDYDLLFFFFFVCSSGESFVETSTNQLIL
ncbi:hypothetical protein Dimus_017611 [Dionaea muscipula]